MMAVAAPPWTLLFPIDPKHQGSECPSWLRRLKTSTKSKTTTYSSHSQAKPHMEVVNDKMHPNSISLTSSVRFPQSIVRSTGKLKTLSLDTYLTPGDEKITAYPQKNAQRKEPPVLPMQNNDKDSRRKSQQSLKTLREHLANVCITGKRKCPKASQKRSPPSEKYFYRHCVC